MVIRVILDAVGGIVLFVIGWFVIFLITFFSPERYDFYDKGIFKDGFFKRLFFTRRKPKKK